MLLLPTMRTGQLHEQESLFLREKKERLADDQKEAFQ